MKGGKKPFYCALWPVAGHVVAKYACFGHQGNAANSKVSVEQKMFVTLQNGSFLRAFSLGHKKCFYLQRMLKASFETYLLEAFAV